MAAVHQILKWAILFVVWFGIVYVLARYIPTEMQTPLLTIIALLSIHFHILYSTKTAKS